MRKSIAVLILGVLAVAASSCSVYTCPTYAKSVKPQAEASRKM